MPWGWILSGMGQGHWILARVRRVRPEVADGALAGLLLVAGLLQITYPHHHDARGLTNNGPLAIAVLLVFTGALLWRRRYPVGAMAFVFIPAFLGPFFHLSDSTAEFTAFQVLVYTSIAASRRGQLRPYAAAAMSVAVDLSHINPEITPLAIVGYNLALSAVPLAAGFAQRNRRRLTAELEIQQAKLDEQGRRLASQALLEERARIAGELNGVVMAAVEEMEAAARRALESLRAGQSAVAKTIAEIEESGRMALLDLRRVLGLLRAEVGVPPLSVAAPVGEIAATLTGGLAPGSSRRREPVQGRARPRLPLENFSGRIWDLLLVAGLSGSGAFELFSPVTGPGPHAVLTDSQTVVLAITMAMPLVARRYFPVATLVLVVAIQQGLGLWAPLYVVTTGVAITLVAVFTVAVSRPPQGGIVAALLGMTVAFAGFSTFERLQGAKFIGGAVWSAPRGC